MHGEKNINGTSWKHTDVHKQLKYMRMPQAIVRAHARTSIREPEASTGRDVQAARHITVTL
jgi:hypothetical protein